MSGRRKTVQVAGNLVQGTRTRESAAFWVTRKGPSSRTGKAMWRERW